MKTKFTKILCLVLVFVMLASTGIFSVFAADAKSELTNLYVKTGQFSTYIWHQYSDFIEVKQGDEIYVGPCFPNQGFHISSFNSSKTDLGKNIKGDGRHLPQRSCYL